MNKENYGFMILAPIIGVKIDDVRTLAQTSEGRAMLTILLLVRSGTLYDELSDSVMLERAEIDSYIDQLIDAGMMDRMEVRNVT